MMKMTSKIEKSHSHTKNSELTKRKSSGSKKNPLMTSKTNGEKNIEIAKNKGAGRSTLFHKDYIRQAYMLCFLGATDKDLATFFDVTEQTINNWKKNYPEFFESLKKGADAKVAESLFKSAIGGHYIEEEKIVHSPNNAGYKVVKLKKQIQPNISAQIFWLKNRQSKQWRDKVDVNNYKQLDQETIAQIGKTFTERMQRSRERQREILIERGLLEENGEP